MSYSFFRNGAAFVIQKDGSTIYSGNGIASMAVKDAKLQILLDPIGTPAGFPESNLFAIADISTIGGAAPAGTIEGVITQVNQLIGSSSTEPVTVDSINSVTASDDELLQIDSLAQTLTYNVDGTLNYIQVTSGGFNYRQTYGYTSGRITSISNWVKQ